MIEKNPNCFVKNFKIEKYRNNKCKKLLFSFNDKLANRIVFGPKIKYSKIINRMKVTKSYDKLLDKYENNNILKQYKFYLNEKLNVYDKTYLDNLFENLYNNDKNYYNIRNENINKLKDKILFKKQFLSKNIKNKKLLDNNYYNTSLVSTTTCNNNNNKNNDNNNNNSNNNNNNNNKNNNNKNNKILKFNLSSDKFLHKSKDKNNNISLFFNPNFIENNKYNFFKKIKNSEREKYFSDENDDDEFSKNLIFYKLSKKYNLFESPLSDSQKRYRLNLIRIRKDFNKVNISDFLKKIKEKKFKNNIKNFKKLDSSIYKTLENKNKNNNNNIKNKYMINNYKKKVFHLSSPKNKNKKYNNCSI